MVPEVEEQVGEIVDRQEEMVVPMEVMAHPEEALAQIQAAELAKEQPHALSAILMESCIPAAAVAGVTALQVLAVLVAEALVELALAVVEVLERRTQAAVVAVVLALGTTAPI